MGLSTKRDNDKLIGEHGTGLKYALCFFVRENIGIELYLEGEHQSIQRATQLYRNQEIEVLEINGKPSPLTLEYGRQWLAWEAVRELYCNATDEGDGTYEVVEHIQVLPGTTQFFISITPDIQQVIDKWDNYFLKATPIFENEKVAIYLNEGEKKPLKLYKQGVLIHTGPDYQNAVFKYDIKDAHLNELRQYQGNAEEAALEAFLQGDQEVIDAFRKSDKAKTFEYDCYYYSYMYEASKFSEAWKEMLFLHPNSKIAETSKSIRVGSYFIGGAKKAGLKTERYVAGGGGGYGGSISTGGLGLTENPKLRSYIEQQVVGFTKQYPKSEKSFQKLVIEIGFRYNDTKFDFHPEGEAIIYSHDLLDRPEIELNFVVWTSLFLKVGESLYNLTKFTAGLLPALPHANLTTVEEIERLKKTKAEADRLQREEDAKPMVNVQDLHDVDAPDDLFAD